MLSQDRQPDETDKISSSQEDAILELHAALDDVIDKYSLRAARRIVSRSVDYHLAVIVGSERGRQGDSRDRLLGLEAYLSSSRA